MEREKIIIALKDKVDPILEQHHGGAILTSYEDGVAWVKLTGACASCPSAQGTMEDIVKSILMEEISEIKDVKLDNSVSEDLLEMARKLLKK